MYQSKVFGASIDEFRMPRDEIELLTSNIAVAAARLRTEEARCEEEDSTLVAFPSASSYINRTPTMQEGKSPLEIAQAQPISSTASSPGPLLKVMPLSDPLSASTSLVVSSIPVEAIPVADRSDIVLMPTPEEQAIVEFESSAVREPDVR